MGRRASRDVPRLDCRRCRHYDPAAPGCRLGKTNPPTKRDTVETAEVLGAQALCLRNPWRESLLLRMYRPPAPLRPADPPLSRRADIQVELLDE